MNHVIFRKMKILNRLAFFLTIILLSCQSDDVGLAEQCVKIKDWDRAQRLYEPILDRDPTNPKLRLGYSLSLYSSAQMLKDSARCSKWKKVDQSLTILVGLDSSKNIKQMWADTQVELADCELDQARTQDALDLIDFALKLDSQNTDALDLKAFIYESMEKWPLAQKSYEQLRRIDPKNVQNYIALARVRASQFDTIGALDYVFEGLKVDSTQNELRELLDLYTSGDE